MADIMAFLRLAATEAGSPVLRFRDRTCDPFAEPDRLSVAEAFHLHAGVDLMASIRGDGSTDADRLGASWTGSGAAGGG
jgi:elongation factor P--(R)-beta-lysine ligase